MVRHLRENATPVNDILVTLDNLQLRSGNVTPVMENRERRMDYIEKGYLSELKRRMGEVGAGIWIEDAWAPCLQRENDVGLMERFLQLPGVRRGQLEKANAARLWLLVITLADLVHESGRYIPDGMLNGEWRAGTDLRWPEVHELNRADWQALRRLLKMTVCRRVPTHQRAN